MPGIERLEGDVAASYPGCPLLSQNQDRFLLERHLEIARLKNKSVEEVLNAMRRGAQATIEAFPHGDNTAFHMLLAELDHPDAKKYIASKLGAM